MPSFVGRRRGVPGWVVVLGLAVFAAAMLAFAWQRRESAKLHSGPLLELRPYGPDDAIAVRRRVDDDGVWLFRLTRKRGMRWTAALPAAPTALTMDAGRVTATLPDGARRAFALEDGARRAPGPTPPAADPPPACPPSGSVLADALGGPPTACARAGDAVLAALEGPEGAQLVFADASRVVWRRAAADAGPFTLVAYGGDLYAQGRRGLLLRVDPAEGTIAAAARAPGGAEYGYPLESTSFSGDRLWLHDEQVMVLLDRRTLRALVGLDRIRAVPVLAELDTLLPPLDGG